MNDPLIKILLKILIVVPHFNSIQSVSPGLVDSEFSLSSGYFENNDCLKDVPMLNPIEIAKCVMFILSTPYEEAYLKLL